jgi:hypothetical protein
MKKYRALRCTVRRYVTTLFAQSIFGRRDDARATTIIKFQPHFLHVIPRGNLLQKFRTSAREAID